MTSPGLASAEGLSTVAARESGGPGQHEWPVPLGGRGRVLQIVGPDGSGKTTLCRALVERISSRARVRVLANRQGASRPGVLPARRPKGNTCEPHRFPPYSPPLSLAKVLYYFLDYHLGWLIRVRPFVRRGGWVLVERGGWDVLVDPLRYRIRLPGRLRRALAHLLPRPGLVLVLGAPPEIIASRKAQLPEAELVRQMAAWRELLPARQPRLYLDTSAPIEDVLLTVSRAVRELEASEVTSRPDSTVSSWGEPMHG